jgi:hypothetical protein
MDESHTFARVLVAGACTDFADFCLGHDLTGFMIRLRPSRPLTLLIRMERDGSRVQRTILLGDLSVRDTRERTEYLRTVFSRMCEALVNLENGRAKLHTHEAGA